MRKITFLLVLLLAFSCYSYGQSSRSTGAKTATTKSVRSIQRSDSILSRVDSLIQVTNMWLEQIDATTKSVRSIQRSDSILSRVDSLIQVTNMWLAQIDATTKSVRSIQRSDSILSRVDSLIQVTNMWLEQIELDNSLKNRYKMYQTDNIYTLLQLDTKTGMIEQVQWSLESNNKGSVTINGKDLTYEYGNNEGSVTINGEDLTYGYGYGSNSFELYPTKNMYQFILLDKTTGRKWHVQWGMKATKRGIRRIY